MLVLAAFRQEFDKKELGTEGLGLLPAMIVQEATALV